MKPLFILAATVLFSACQLLTSPEQEASAVAEEWADAYFNCDYHDAERLVTRESVKWLRFAASNTNPADLQALQQEGPVNTEVSQISPITDTTFLATILVDRYLSASMQEEPHVDDNGTFTVAIVKSERKWKVKMADLPRSEKQSRAED